MILITDGLSEARDAAGELFGMDRILNVVRANLSCPAGEIIRCLQEAVADFSGRRQPADDVTCVILRVRPDANVLDPGPPAAIGRRDA